MKQFKNNCLEHTDIWAMIDYKATDQCIFSGPLTEHDLPEPMQMARGSLEGHTGVPVRVCLTSQDGSVPSSRVAGPSAACVCLRDAPLQTRTGQQHILSLTVSCMYTATHALAYMQQGTRRHTQLCTLVHVPKHFAAVRMSTCEFYMPGYMVGRSTGPGSVPPPAFHPLPCDCSTSH